ncbi:hypothetical protein RRG08_029673 [Elysia crispata]|uniref:Uncharacterized protein n=1 Tax=Elysia crispata TaxID=231223 RepID=A0AAE1EED1_9GAST|nr:hypothetical protein RRG08_029673 [Elysia crispata]
MELAWSDIPSARPTFEQISKMLRRGRSSRKSIMDNMMEAMEDYMVHLEDEVEAKESALQSVKTSLDSLMAEVIPPQVISCLTSGQKFESKIHPALGLIMLEIVNWTVVMETDAVDSALNLLDNLNSHIKQVCEKYQACCLDSQHQHFKTVVVGLDAGKVLLGRRSQEVAHLALDLIEVSHATVPRAACRPSRLYVIEILNQVIPCQYVTVSLRFTDLNVDDITACLLHRHLAVRPQSETGIGCVKNEFETNITKYSYRSALRLAQSADISSPTINSLTELSETFDHLRKLKTVILAFSPLFAFARFQIHIVRSSSADWKSRGTSEGET